MRNISDVFIIGSKKSVNRGGISMNRNSKTQAKYSKKKKTIPTLADPDSRAPAMLARTSVYRRLPIDVRRRLNEVILSRPSDCATMEAIADKFELTKRYNISLAALRSYASRLEMLVKPTVMSQLKSAVLGCLPESYRQQIIDGSQVMLLSRLIHVLSRSEESGEAKSKSGDGELSVAELVKIATVLTGMARQANIGRTANKRSGSAEKNHRTPSEDQPKEPEKLSESVRAVYGLPWPSDHSD